MPLSLVIRCPSCGKAREVRDPARNSSDHLGLAVRNAAQQKMQVELSEGQIEIGCECVTHEPEALVEVEANTGFRMSLLQGLLVLTALAIVLAIFRRPISLLFEERVYYWVIAPWSLYGWLFWGGDIVNPKVYGKDLVCIIAFVASTIVAILLPMVVASGAVHSFKELWQLAKAKPNRTSDLG